jgi:hypothetical protein
MGFLAPRERSAEVIYYQRTWTSGPADADNRTRSPTSYVRPTADPAGQERLRGPPAAGRVAPR